MPDNLYVQGLLWIYELSKKNSLKTVYGRTALRYAAICQSLGEPDKFRLQYIDIRSLVAEIISGALTKQEAIKVSLLRNYSLFVKFPKKNQKFFRKSVVVCNLEQKPI